MTQQLIPVPSIAKFSVHRPPRPLMARDADSMYWMSRYVERAEHIARLLLVHSNLLVDVGDLTPQLQEQQWHSVLTIMRSGTLPALPEAPDANIVPLGHRIARYMTFDLENVNSLVSCLTRARENARSIRENISAEMWESLNTLYWSIRSDDASARFEDSPDDFYRQIMTGSFLFQGLTDQTLGHEQRWLFTQLGKYLERIDVTARLLEVKFSILMNAEDQMDTALRNIHWMAVLRSGCSIEAYRRRHLADMDPLRVASFLLLERKFPRSVRFCVGKAARGDRRGARRGQPRRSRPRRPHPRPTRRPARIRRAQRNPIRRPPRISAAHPNQRRRDGGCGAEVLFSALSAGVPQSNLGRTS